MEEAVQSRRSPADACHNWQDVRDSIEWNDASRPTFDIKASEQQCMQVLRSLRPPLSHGSGSSRGTPPPTPSTGRRSRDSASDTQQQRPSPSALCQVMRWARQDATLDCQPQASSAASTEALETPAANSEDAPLQEAEDASLQQSERVELDIQAANTATTAAHMAGAHSPAYTTPQVKRSRRTSRQKWCPSSNAERRKEGANSTTDEDVTSAAFSALQDYRAASATVLQEYREAQALKSMHGVLPPSSSPVGRRPAPCQLGDLECQLLTGDSTKALVHSASDVVLEAWKATGADQARVLIFLPRTHLLLWYQISFAWDRVHGIPVRGIVSDASQSPGQLSREDDGRAGVCLAIDALVTDTDSQTSVSETPSVPTPPSGIAADGGSLSADQKSSRRRKRRRPSHSVDDDDSENDTPGAKKGAPSIAPAPTPWDLVIVDNSSSEPQDPSTMLDMARSYLRGASAKQWILLQVTAPSSVRTDASTNVIAGSTVDLEQHQRTLIKVPTPLRLSAEKRRLMNCSNNKDDTPESPGQIGGS